MPATPHTLWTLPVPSTALIHGPQLMIHPRREYRVKIQHESGHQFRTLWLVCREVIAFRCTYLYGLTAEMITSAYDRLVDLGALGESDWLREMRANAASNRIARTLRHLRICFDDGPCFEWICEDFSIEDDPRADDGKAHDD